MQYQGALERVGLWFAVLLASIVVAALAKDTGFQVHAAIVGVAAFILMWAAAGRFDPLAARYSFFKFPEGPSRYDDDTIRWGVIATMFWGLAGLAAGLVRPCSPGAILRRWPRSEFV